MVNAVIPIAGFANTAKVAALPSAAGVTLGTQSFTETTAGAFFATGPTTVVLTPSAGTLTSDVTPTITVPAGYTKPSHHCPGQLHLHGDRPGNRDGLGFDDLGSGDAADNHP